MGRVTTNLLVTTGLALGGCAAGGEGDPGVRAVRSEHIPGLAALETQIGDVASFSAGIIVLKQGVECPDGDRELPLDENIRAAEYPDEPESQYLEVGAIPEIEYRDIPLDLRRSASRGFIVEDNDDTPSTTTVPLSPEPKAPGYEIVVAGYDYPDRPTQIYENPITGIPKAACGEAAGPIPEWHAVGGPPAHSNVVVIFSADCPLIEGNEPASELCGSQAFLAGLPPVTD